MLKSRFIQYSERHPPAKWKDVKEKHTDNVLSVIYKMEETGGELDLIVMPDGRMAYVDCCIETSKERKGLCYDRAAWANRKQNKLLGSAKDAAKEIGATLINEEEYFHLQSLGDFDLKGQIWLNAPEDFRQTGDGLFANKRHGRTFVYYNGVESYYSNRGFRTILYLD
nr:DUF4256 domain-containing protein [Fastidiosipila sanguinis]